MHRQHGNSLSLFLSLSLSFIPFFPPPPFFMCMWCMWVSIYVYVGCVCFHPCACGVCVCVHHVHSDKVMVVHFTY